MVLRRYFVIVKRICCLLVFWCCRFQQGPLRLSYLMRKSLAQDPLNALNPILPPQQLEAMDRRVAIVLKVIRNCLSKFADSQVLIGLDEWKVSRGRSWWRWSDVFFFAHFLSYSILFTVLFYIIMKKWIYFSLSNQSILLVFIMGVIFLAGFCWGFFSGGRILLSLGILYNCSLLLLQMIRDGKCTLNYYCFPADSQWYTNELMNWWHFIMINVY